MAQFIAALIGGIALGATYALIALGIVLIFRATKTFNFAHGELMLIPAFLVGSWQAHRTGSVGLAFVLSIVIVAVVGGAFYTVVLRRMTGVDHFLSMVATLGLSSILDGAILLWFGSPQYAIKLTWLPAGTASILGARISETSLVVAGFTLLLALTVAGVLRFTNVGRRVRAAGQNALLASQAGINVKRIYLGSWMCAAALAGVAGIAYGASNIVGTSMTDVALTAFPAILIGGLDSIDGAIIGGLGIGIFQGMVASYLQPSVIDVTTYGLVLIVMLLAPQGLFGTRIVSRV